MGEAKRRREDLGDLYGTPQGSNRGDPLAHHVQHLAKVAEVEDVEEHQEQARKDGDAFRKLLDYLLTPADQLEVRRLMEEDYWLRQRQEEPSTSRSTWTYAPAPEVPPKVVAVEIWCDGQAYGVDPVCADPAPASEGSDQETLDREALGQIRRAMADGHRVVLVGTAAARPLAEAAGLSWLHEHPEGEPLPQAIAYDPDVAGNGLQMPVKAYGGAVVVLGAGASRWLDSPS